MHEFKRDQRRAPSTKSDAELITLASLRWEIQTAMACINNEDDLRTILSRVRRMKPLREELDDE